MEKVTSKVHTYNPNLRVIFVGASFWANVPKKEATAYKKELTSTLARDPWYCYRRGY